MKKYILIFCFPLLLYGCGPQFIYPNLDELVPWYIDDYISLKREQSTILEERLAQQLEWHCRTQLPLYSESLKELAKDLEDPTHPISYQRIRYYHDKFLNHWRDLLRQLGPDIAAILASASGEQITELFQNLEKQNQKYRSKYVDLPANKLRKKRQKRMTKSLKHWISRLNSEQERAVLDWSERLKPFAADRLQYREIVLAEFRNLLEQRRHDADFHTSFTELLAHPERLRPTAYQTKIDYNNDVTIRFLMTVDRLLTAKQRAHLLNRIESLAADFDKLSCDPTKVRPEDVSS